MVNKMGLDSFIQICIVVENMEEAVKSWSAKFNIPEPEIVVNKPNRSKDLTYRGEIAEYGIRLAIAEMPSSMNSRRRKAMLCGRSDIIREAAGRLWTARISSVSM